MLLKTGLNDILLPFYGGLFMVFMVFIYINDLPNYLNKSAPSIFAGDTNIWVNGTSLDQIRNNLISEGNKLCNWRLANEIRHNVKSIISIQDSKIYNVCETELKIGASS